jgi:hypothetical protein
MKVLSIPYEHKAQTQGTNTRHKAQGDTRQARTYRTQGTRQRTQGTSTRHKATNTSDTSNTSDTRQKRYKQKPFDRTQGRKKYAAQIWLRKIAFCPKIPAPKFRPIKKRTPCRSPLSLSIVLLVVIVIGARSLTSALILASRDNNTLATNLHEFVSVCLKVLDYPRPKHEKGV